MGYVGWDPWGGIRGVTFAGWVMWFGIHSVGSVFWDPLGGSAVWDLWGAICSVGPAGWVMYWAPPARSLFLPFLLFSISVHFSEQFYHGAVSLGVGGMMVIDLQRGKVS